jgi:hypothetical protein
MVPSLSLYSFTNVYSLGSVEMKWFFRTLMAV